MLGIRQRLAVNTRRRQVGLGSLDGCIAVKGLREFEYGGEDVAEEPAIDIYD